MGNMDINDRIADIISGGAIGAAFVLVVGAVAPNSNQTQINNCVPLDGIVESGYVNPLNTRLAQVPTGYGTNATVLIYKDTVYSLKEDEAGHPVVEKYSLAPTPATK
jgi:hypothetical protein